VSSVARAGIRAAEGILKDFFGLPVAKANPLTKPGFDAFVFGVMDELKKTADPIEGAALKAMVSKLQRQWGGMSEAEQTKAIDAAAKDYLSIARDVGPAVGPVLKDHGARIAVATKLANAQTFNLAIEPNLDIADAGAIAFASKSQCNFIRSASGVRATQLSQVARDVVAKGIEDGHDHYTIGAELAKQLNQTDAARSDAYWRMIASVFTARARTYSTLRSFDEAGISSYQFESVLDERTSQQCRFMHGRVFPVSGALGKFAAAEAAEDPEDVKAITPWPGVGKTEDGDLALYVKQGGSRKFIAQVTESAMGQKDNPGKFKTGMSNAQLSDLGVSQPPLHGHCRSTIVPIFGASAPPPNPEPPPAPPRPPPVPSLAPAAESTQVTPANVPENLAELVRPLPLEGDLETHGEFSPEYMASQAHKKKLESLPTLSWSPDYAIAPIQPAPTNDKGKVVPPYPKLSGVHIMNAMKADAQDVPIANIVHATAKPTVAKADVSNLLEGKAQLTDKPVLVKFQGKFYAFESGAKGVAKPFDIANEATALYCTDQASMKAHIIDGDAIAAKPPKPPKPPKVTALPPLPATPPPAPVAPPLPSAAPAQTSETVLGQQIGEARGSNKGGMYLGQDGVKRYVKFYDDPTQAQCEHLANSIYRDLGVGAPESQTFRNPKGGTGYASVIFEGGKTLAEAGLNEERAKKFMKGFVGDVLTGNWDAVGTGLDNAMLLKDGNVIRIDNGGTFLFRAKAGRKSASVLNDITEWDKFFDAGVNPHYSKVAKAAGYASAEDLGVELRSQVAAVKALRDKHGGWDAYVDKIAGEMKGVDKSQVVKMLDSRTKLLDERIAEFDKPKPKAGNLVQFSTVAPKVGLKPNDLPEHVFLGTTKRAIDASVDKGLMPDTGERIDRYRDRTNKELQKLTGTEGSRAKNSIKGFSNGDYTDCRRSEEKGKPNQDSQNIIHAYDKVSGEERTVYRGIHLDTKEAAESVLNMHLQNEVWGLGRDGKFATTSTSWDINKAASFGAISISETSATTYSQMSVMYKIKNKTGIAIETISFHEHEREVLVSRKARFRTTGMSWAKGSNRKVLIVEAEELE
jgi:SPP1 gp7 family putative phage head morphogenesis protein